MNFELVTYRGRSILGALALAWLAWLLSLPPRPPAWIVALSGAPLLILGSWLLHRPTGEQWRQFVRRTADLHGLAALLLMALGVQFEDAHGVTTDGVIYFSQLRSVIFDRDLNVAAEFAFLNQPPRPYHVVPIGPTFVWFPLYICVAGFDAVGRALGWSAAPADPAGIGLTLPYVRAALVSSFVIGAVGMIVLHRYLRAEFDAGVAFAATLLLFGATPLVWYMVYEPSMTHAASFGFVALFVVAAARWTSVTISSRRAAILGALLGAAFLSRPQEALFALFPAVLLVATPADARERVTAAARLAIWSFIGALPFLIVQGIHSAILFSRERFALVGADGYLDFFNSRWDDTLWSSWHGFLSWSPVAYLALLGTVGLLTRRARWAIAALVILFLMAWINGATADWAAGWSFGGRRFTSCLVILAPGLALVIEYLTRRPMFAIVAMLISLIAWNQLLFAQYTLGLVRPGEAVSFGQIVRQQAGLATRPPFVYPFAFPANAWFAWRTGLPTERYDLLAPEQLRSSIDLPLDGAAGKFLLDGWGPRGADQWGELRWIDRSRAELVLPLALPAGSPITLEIRWRTRLLDPPATSAVKVLLNDIELGTASPDARSPSVFTLTDRAPHRWRRGFNRIAFQKDDGSPPVAVYRVAIKAD